MFFENLLLATGNRGKYEEFRAILPESFVGSLLFAPEVGGLAVKETGGSYAMNAVLKAKAWAEASGLPSLADDSGLDISSLIIQSLLSTHFLLSEPTSCTLVFPPTTAPV